MAVMQKKPMRRNALISPWGVGSIVPFPGDESLMIAGLDMWKYNAKDEFIIRDERLQKRLGVEELRLPPDFRDRKSDPINSNLIIPAVRFPRWQYCPYCGNMEYVGLFTKQPTCSAFQWSTGRNCDPNARNKRKLIPERFVVVCPNGHIDDFPVAEWLHYGSKHPYDPATCHIRRSTGGTSAALTGVRYKCSCGVEKSIAAALRPGALARIGYSCKGSKPWLGVESDPDEAAACDPNELKVLQRGATNVWFADTRSSIHIPTDDPSTSRAILAVVNEFIKYISSHRVNGELDKAFIQGLAESKKVDYDELYKAFEQRIDNIEGLPEVTENTTEDEYRVAEYKMLIKNSGGDALDFHCENIPITEYDDLIQDCFKSISLVKKLRETRAFVGFSRLEPNSESDIRYAKKMIRLGKGNWLPAVEVYGEGIFFEFNDEKLAGWAQRKSVKDRIQILSNSYERSKFGAHATGSLRAEFVLLHTFAHLIINQLSYECGYGSSSIKERIYCEKTSNDSGMCGVLIYTASGDAEGSLGGLVRQGEHGKLEDTILAALRNAEWCSSDPICIQSEGQGPESLNLAACHNCALLPETCCENGNRLLDRGLLVGVLGDSDVGFFSGLSDSGLDIDY